MAWSRPCDRTVIREVLTGFQPDLVLVDHMPGGANRDLVPALRLLRSLNHPTRVVLGVRDIIDNPSVTCDVWRREGFYDTLKRYYDSVLIYGSPEIFPTASAYGSIRRCPRACGTAATSATWIRSKGPT